jgi:predicted pyridoxine 5'-phosphate oxidase superfamily flavin-nucleotide-binding protein
MSMAESALPDSGTAFGERVRRRLHEEQIIWITTVGNDGSPHPTRSDSCSRTTIRT